MGQQREKALIYQLKIIQVESEGIGAVEWFGSRWMGFCKDLGYAKSSPMILIIIL